MKWRSTSRRVVLFSSPLTRGSSSDWCLESTTWAPSTLFHSIKRKSLKWCWLCKPNIADHFKAVKVTERGLLVDRSDLVKGSSNIRLFISGIFNSMTTSGRPLMKSTISGRLLILFSTTVTWLTPETRSVTFWMLKIYQPDLSVRLYHRQRWMSHPHLRSAGDGRLRCCRSRSALMRSTFKSIFSAASECAVDDQWRRRDFRITSVKAFGCAPSNRSDRRPSIAVFVA